MKVSVIVKPGSKKGDVIEEVSGGLVVFLRAKAHDGEANKSLVKILAKHFGVAQTRIKLVSGSKSRKKVMEII